MKKSKIFIDFLFKRPALAFKWFLSNIAKHSVLCWFFPFMRAFIWKCIGCHMGKKIQIGWDVFLDVNHAKYLFVEDDVWITNRAVILCHRRDISNYQRGNRYKNEPTYPRKTVIKKGASIGTGAMVMPGVTIGEGAVVGAYSLVTKDVPAWSVVAGVPAKVIREL